MPTVWASVPMQAPTTTSLAAEMALDGRVDLLAGEQRELALDDLDEPGLDEVLHRAVNDEEGEPVTDRLGVHEQRGLDAHLAGEPAGPRPRRACRAAAAG